MPSYRLHTANDAEEIYAGKHVELIVAQGVSTETAHFITKQENYLISLTFTVDLTAHCATRRTRNTDKQTSILNLAHKNTVTTSRLPTTQYDSPLYVVTTIYG